MTVSASDVAAVLRERSPGVPTKKLHKLLYYCQGHHIAAFGTPLFPDRISAWDRGPVVGTLWYDEKQGVEPSARNELDEAQLNTVGYVLSRYGALSGTDLEHLTHSEAPWRRADRSRRPGESAPIEQGWMEEHFRAADIADMEDDDVVLDSADVTRWLKDATARRREQVDEDLPGDVSARRHALIANKAVRG